MSNYTEEELKGMTRVELRRAAIAVLGIDNKECSNTKSQDLIDRILAEGGEGGGSKPKASGRGGKGGSKPKASSAGRGRGRSKPKEEEAPPPAEDVGDLGVVVDRIDAVGKTVDESHTEVKELLEVIQEQQVEIQRQQFMLFGLMTDLYKFTGEPDELEERMNELDAEWEAQGNEDGGE
jgi:hypothetical protein